MAHVRLVLAFLGVLTTVGCIKSTPRVNGLNRNPMLVSAPYFGERGSRPAPAVDPRDVLFWNRWRDESIEPSAFVVLPGSHEVHAMYGSDGLLDRILLPEARLYASSTAQHAMHVEPDRLLHRYDVAGLSLLVYENPGYMTMRVSATAQPEETTETFVRRIMARLLNYAPTWHFFPPGGPDESARFSTELGYTIALGGIKLGISGAVVTGGLYFTHCRWNPEDYSGQIPGTYPVLNDHLREHWAKVRGTATP